MGAGADTVGPDLLTEDGSKLENLNLVGDAGGERGGGGGVWIHLMETGALGSAGEKATDSTLVCSYTDAPVERAWLRSM
jgi:hypothetical protein